MQYASAALGSIGAFVISFIRFPKHKKSSPCTVAKGNPTTFVLPMADNICPVGTPKYDLVYFSPVNDPLSNNSLIFTSATTAVTAFFSPSGPSGRGQFIQQNPQFPNVPLFSFNYGSQLQTEYVTMQARYQGPTDIVNLYVGQTNDPATLSLTTPLNMCPQSFIKNATAAMASQFATAVPMPVKSAQPLEPVLWIIPGLSTAQQSSNGINVPSLTSAPSGLNYVSTQGLASTLYVVCKSATTIFIELVGASGGNVPIYTAGIDPATGLPRMTPGYTGGQPGVVFGLYNLSQNDVLKIFIGSKGDEVLNTTGLTTFDGNGQGGLGTVFGGANGGGASYCVHYKSASFKNSLDLTLTAAIDSNAKNTLVCVAGGGGGASRNASGGHAGSFGSITYGTSVQDSLGKTVSANGSAGGSQFITGDSPVKPNINANGLSGGGGTQTRGGVSTVPNQVPTDTSSWGHSLKPFLDTGLDGCHGGGSVATDIGSGGGGGGGGLYGGGAGSWNGLPKPNNVHGGGGGGSSWTGLLKPATSDVSATLNAYRSGKIVWPVNSYGSLVIGCPLVAE